MSDLIERQAAIKEVHTVIVDGEPFEVVQVETLIGLPSVQPEQKTAKWVPSFDGQFTGGAYWFHCSECHHIVPVGLQSGYHFCPNCGARMVE